MENKTLSEKEFGNDYRYGQLMENKTAFWKDDVKQFIKDLKIKIVENDIFVATEIYRIINELAGKELID